MMAELVLSYALNSNQPIHIRGAGSGIMNSEIRLNLERRLGVLGDRAYFKLSPYVWLDNITPGRAGAEAEVGYRFDGFDLGLFHESKHSLDLGTGEGIYMDGIRMRIRFGEP